MFNSQPASFYSYVTDSFPEASEVNFSGVSASREGSTYQVLLFGSNPPLARLSLWEDFLSDLGVVAQSVLITKQNQTSNKRIPTLNVPPLYSTHFAMAYLSHFYFACPGPGEQLVSIFYKGLLIKLCLPHLFSRLNSSSCGLSLCLAGFKSPTFNHLDWPLPGPSPAGPC